MTRTYENSWHRDGQGRDIPPEIQSEFLDWLLSDVRIPSSQDTWGEQHGVNERTVRRWKQDPRFIKLWEQRITEKNVGPERVSRILDVLYEAAEKGDVKAATEYMKYVDRILPPKKVEREPEDLELWSDEELAEVARALVGDVAVEPASGPEPKPERVKPPSAEELGAVPMKAPWLDAV